MTRYKNPPLPTTPVTLPFSLKSPHPKTTNTITAPSSFPKTTMDNSSGINPYGSANKNHITENKLNRLMVRKEERLLTKKENEALKNRDKRPAKCRHFFPLDPRTLKNCVIMVLLLLFVIQILLVLGVAVSSIWKPI